MKPNELEPYWVPFTANRAFKKNPRMFVGAKGMHFIKPDGTKVIDATSGLFCVNAGHCREPIVKAIQEMAATLDYSPAFQYGHPKVFELASRLALLAPGDLDYAFFANSGSEAVDTALKIALAYHKAKGEGAPGGDEHDPADEGEIAADDHARPPFEVHADCRLRV